MGWQYRHRWWRDRLAGLDIRQSMSRKGNCIDNAATEQVFGHLKDEFYAGREFASYEQFKNELDAYIIHRNTKRRQIRLEGHTPEEFRNMSLTAQSGTLNKPRPTIGAQFRYSSQDLFVFLAPLSEREPE